jgi:hypothetical protein
MLHTVAFGRIRIQPVATARQSALQLKYAFVGNFGRFAIYPVRRRPIETADAPRACPSWETMLIGVCNELEVPIRSVSCLLRRISRKLNTLAIRDAPA